MTDAHQRALSYIDERLPEALTLADIARESGLSPFHFSRLFTAVHGRSVMAYVRWRRLVWAARRLRADQALSLAELALDSGFESQPAFTRAFKRTFGLTPGRFRRIASIPVPLMRETPMSDASILNADAQARLELRDRARFRPAFHVAGLAGRFDADTRPAIPGLWDKLIPRLPLPGQIPGFAYGLCFSVGPERGFGYMAGVEVEPDAKPPSGFEIRGVPAATYAVFRLTITGEELHPQMAAAAMDIWGRRLKAEGLEPNPPGPDFELYPDDFDQRRAGDWVEYWIPVKT